MEPIGSETDRSAFNRQPANGVMRGIVMEDNVIELRDGIVGTNFIRRFHGSLELPPLYVPSPSETIGDAISIGKVQAIANGIREFVIVKFEQTVQLSEANAA